MSTTIKQPAVKQTEVRKEITREATSFSRLFKGAYDKNDFLTLELKQIVKTLSFYPKKSVSTELQDNPFTSAQDVGEQEPVESTQTRVVWLPVLEAQNWDEEKVLQLLKTNPGNCIQRIYSNHPILNENQKAGISSGVTSLSIIANRQVIRYGVGENAGQLILKDGKPQYKIDSFKVKETEDLDLRTSDPSDFYASEEIYAELNSVPTSDQEVL